MKVHHTLICFFLTLQDVETKVFNAGSGVLTGTEGGNITVKCSFFFSGWRRFLCKDECRKQDILFETEGVRSQGGRYSIEYNQGAFTEKATICVTITHLNKSDSGRYSCGLERTLGPTGYDKFEIRVTDAPLPTSLPSSSTPTTTTQSLSSSVGSSSSSSAPETTKQPEASPAGSGFFLVLVVCVPVVIVVILLAVVLLVLYKKKMKDSWGLNTRGNSDHTNNEYVIEENWPPASTYEDSTYQSLHPATRDHDQIYCTLTHVVPT
ncbi:uncharacterized protein [Trachinotus anak]|uniref:uncharacterized protein n=1 Tax=Trachinotus anak TaxID=443729 RepID=UPI0039F21D6A